MRSTNDMHPTEPIAVRLAHPFWSLSNRIIALLLKPTHFQCTMTIGRPPREVYGFWRDFNNLAMATRRIDRVTVRDARHSHWLIAAPLGVKLSWNAEITIDESRHRIGWRTFAPADVPHVGQVIFRGIDDGKATEIAIAIDYRMPLGPIGEILARLLGGGALDFIESEIALFKKAIETATAAETLGARPTPTQVLLREARDLETGGAVHHPETIADTLEDHKSRAAKSAEANNTLDEAMGPPNAPVEVAPRKSSRRAPRHNSDSVDAFADRRERMRHQH